MDLRAKIQAIRMQISMPDKVSRAFSDLEKLLRKEFPVLLTSFMTQKASYQKNEQEFLDGVIRMEDHRIEYRKVVKALNHLLDRILEADRKLSIGDLHKGSDLSIVSCDRKEVLKQFSLSFDRKEEEGRRSFFYLISGQRFSQADSLVKRLITTLKEDKISVKYTGFDQILIREIDIGRGDNPKDGYYFFRKAFNKQIRPQVKTLDTFARNIDRHYPAYQGAIYVPFAFRINFQEESWTNVKRLIQWIATEFAVLRNESNRKFVFFLIVHLKETIGRRRNRKIWFSSGRRKPAQKLFLEKLQTLDVPDLGITVLPPLSRVSLADLDDWYRHYEPNEALRVQKLEQLVKSLGGGNQWDMSYVEMELARVVSEFRERKFGI